MEFQNTEFQDFQENFDKLTRNLPDDTVEYAIYIIDSKLTEVQITTSLRRILQSANVYAKEITKDYIWQRDPFELNLVRKDDLWSLQGRSNYGDSVADEWLIVYLIREITRRSPECWARVHDNDGEFLLIEAANALPKWLEPQVGENRVWIQNGALKVIPKQDGTALETKAPTLGEAVEYIKTKALNLICSPLIEEEAFYRIRNYPDAIRDSFHRSRIPLPRNLAYILHEHPAYISPAVEAFYLRDPIALRPLQTEGATNFLFPPKDMINVVVKFTKVGFAQLRSQEFAPPRAWEDVLDDDVPDQEASRAEIGMKLACGFEMLVADPQNQDKQVVREIKMMLEDLESGDDTLPTKEDIAKCEQKEDDDKWLDINYDDFEAELTGKGRSHDGKGKGFGDKAAQENLQKLVARFEQFMNVDATGSDGSDISNEDELDDDGEDSDEDEDQDVSFDEQEFANLMSQMMGFPPGANTDFLLDKTRQPTAPQTADEEDDAEIQSMMQQMEAELKGTGVLDIDRAPRPGASGNSKGKRRVIEEVNDDAEDEKEDEDVNIDFNLAKNLLESYQAQGGAAGPAGNLFEILGVHLPPDKDEK